MMHAGFVLISMMVAAPLASFIPLSALAGVLVVVCWNMAEKNEFLGLLRNWRTATVLLATFGLTLAKDLTFGIIAGCLLATVFAFSIAPSRAKTTKMTLGYKRARRQCWLT
jgi:SulP family sulfate permease